jgi:hypothetical protein
VDGFVKRADQVHGVAWCLPWAYCCVTADQVSL